MNALPFKPWIQAVCPSPRRHAQTLIVRKGLETGLDIGCGENSLLSPLRDSGFRSTGGDASAEMLESAKRRNLHDEYIMGDFRNVEVDRKFDVVVLSQVIEHFSREEGLVVLDRAESLARCLVYLENAFIEPLLQGGLGVGVLVVAYCVLGQFPAEFQPDKIVFATGIELPLKLWGDNIVRGADDFREVAYK